MSHTQPVEEGGQVIVETFFGQLFIPATRIAISGVLSFIHIVVLLVLLHEEHIFQTLPEALSKDRSNAEPLTPCTSEIARRLVLEYGGAEGFLEYF